MTAPLFLIMVVKCTNSFPLLFPFASHSQVESEGEIVTGDPGPQIIQEATRINADAIVVGSHGRGLLAR